MVVEILLQGLQEYQMGDLAGRLVRGIRPWPDTAGEALLRNSACPEKYGLGEKLVGDWLACQEGGARKGPETTAFLVLT